MWKCKHCKKEFDFNKVTEKAGHSRWCKSNPKYDKYIEYLRSKDMVSVMNAARKQSGRLNQFSVAKLNGEIASHPLKGKKNTWWKPHTEETKELLRQKALSSSHRRLRKGMILYNGIWLDSSWEFELAKRLDELKIKWKRPEPIKWIDNKGKKHNYFPDFYLVDYDLFLDPKNPAAYQNQKEKIEILEKQLKNIIFIKTLDECKNFSVT
jgi:hypothetical protein